ncbi:autotransporter assembly complex protein TamA [Pukyongiella litopenaei]|uniref:BamA/TamA family outer membrane protein n=1 Tax=Pukyongiella litopenaei TaxID=2605946 RepID=A0A2S0MT37_9RHOB|nr:BamA/TamA family outer membrane protein [Pukyongiella litopenaei]AVO38977.1 BamA/TamA family outer membrane protein [Pukyongiella litopenaei]
MSGLALETSLTAPGASDDLRKRLAAASSAISAEERGLETAQEVLAAARSDYRTLVQVLYDEGRFSPEINIRIDGQEAADIVPISLPPKYNRIAITVRPGPSFTLGRARVAPLAPGTEMPESFAPTRPANTGIIQDATAAGVKGWRYAGHPKVEVANQAITADHRANRIDADITLAPGPQLRFGRLRVSGNERVREDAIRAMAGWPEGEVYHPDKVKKVGTRLRRSGAFASVSLAEDEIANPDGTLDFGAAFEEEARRRITLGGEISSRQGLDVSAIWIHRNLFGAAERLRLEARVRNIGGEDDVDGLLSFRLDRPAVLGPDDSMFYIADLEQLHETHYSARRALIGMGVRRVFSDRLFAELSITAGVSKADDAFGSDREFNLIALPLRVEWDKRDNRLNPTRGFYLDGRIAPFAGFGGSASGLRTVVDGRGYFGLGASRRVVLAGRVLVGSTAWAELSEISPDLLFYSGGAGTVRGQPYQSLGIPINNDVTGGRSMLIASAEARGRITDKLWVVGFYDFGAVDSNAFVTADSAHHSGAGLGVRYDLGGFGPLRFDLGYPVTGDTDDGLQFYIGIGQAF